MNRKFLLGLVAAMVAAVAMAGYALAASAGPAVHVQIKTLTKTLRQRVVHGQTGWITKGGTPRGKCSANSAAGALGAATHGRWTGKYYSGLGIFVTSILGVKPKGKDSWAFYVNGKLSNKGVCAVRLHRGERLLFKVVK